MGKFNRSKNKTITFVQARNVLKSFERLNEPEDFYLINSFYDVLSKLNMYITGLGEGEKIILEQDFKRILRNKGIKK